MQPSARRPFDLATPAPNGLRRGRTTGTCATAAVKAALLRLVRGETVDAVEVSLPDPDYCLEVPIARIEPLASGAVRADVLKYAGDDPDNTDGATIFAEVSVNHAGEVRFMAAPGVGTVTQPGLRVPPGEPAINPVPRQMMRMAVDEVLAGGANPGFDLAIGCVDGERIARRTFNPMLGIVGGISILGTSGIVEPMSLAAWMASIEVYVRVALGDAPEAIAFTPGKIGRAYAAHPLALSKKQVVQIANFIGASLDYAQTALEEDRHRLGTLWVLGHPGKLAKVLDGVWDTHSSKSGMAMGSVAAVAAELGVAAALVEQIKTANTVENVIQILQHQPGAQAFWTEIEQRIAARMQPRVPRADRVAVRLFAMDGTPLGAAGQEAGA
ncbi:cobalt-precorrin-5B (C(1))-methyltransferase CbiD [Ralstonia pseudosolanacearum]|uniref:Cobalt-precorrin-5B C(1)-methyltransferase n=1 Tax=Ralstonia nicotianae (strain ATCC BAA-1114 / GMI1000) TaxID=267608 RepID=CBID_RALN1|nr:cobalt-precorrin-5B (C(1))-methyltransferase CbiD [Ralstonia pseudosolanacearum]Q8XS59.1 RecName: Full=Cobalt-precorrin-5B C(1)-methyltransferase; AltName: Full=Cobalt-precorrin-6A synthase [Ralstonia pseudosolanacearum GMI1000]AST29633.1 cobalt-precorrin-5B (C(1))-methyltransferase [Ralstonia pseudosolanacearum]MDC6285377.1 cobalt-precorrin-5B (C(1))-methyltransferase CbiD [Ralstonia pseudosolanacearum]CAD17773.1 putative cobalt-precorrin-6a synthase [deacetylating] . transmembrane protein 